MAQPVAFTITVDFSNEEANGVSGRSTVRTAALDGLFTSLKSTLDQILTNLAILQRDDLALNNGIVTVSSLSSAVLALMASVAFSVAGGWATATVYTAGKVVLQNSFVYVCMVAHTSGTFADDLAAGKWGQITATSTAIATSFSPTATISAINVQAAINELDQEIRPSQSILNRELFNGL